MKMLSLFSGCGGMDIGFEGDFVCLRKSINSDIHPDWIKESYGDWVRVAPTIFDTVFANDIRPDAKAAWVSYFGQRKTMPTKFIISTALWISSSEPEQEKKYFPTILTS